MAKNTEGFVQKVRFKKQPLRNLVEIFNSSFKYYKLHKYLIKTQCESIQFIKNNQCEDEVIIYMDFAENFSTKSQRDVQSAFFAKKQISIFTSLAYVGNKHPKSYLILNDDISHSKQQVQY